MRIADSTVTMLSGRNFTQTGMNNRLAGHQSSFMGMLSRYGTGKDHGSASGEAIPGKKGIP